MLNRKCSDLVNYRDMDGPRDHYTDWSKSERQKQISCINAYMLNRKHSIDDLIYKIE